MDTTGSINHFILNISTMENSKSILNANNLWNRL